MDDELNLGAAEAQVHGPQDLVGVSHSQLVGYDGSEAMMAVTHQMRDALASGAAMSRRDWRRALIATELIFGSDTFGAGVEWETVTGRDDGADLRLLREIQRKLVAV